MSAEPGKVAVLLAEGAEETETVSVVDVLRRAGVEVLLLGLAGGGEVECSRGIKLVPDGALSELGEEEFTAIVLPGGVGGAERLAASVRVGRLLTQHWQSGGIIAAICAAPTVLKGHGLASGCRLTSHPSVREQLQESYQWVEERICWDGKLLTSQGPGTSLEFALELVERLRGAEIRVQVSAPMML